MISIQIFGNMLEEKLILLDVLGKKEYQIDNINEYFLTEIYQTK